MEANVYPIPCPFDSCIYHVRQSDEAGGIYCRHPEKCRFLGSHACPLYQRDWTKQLDSLRK